MSLVEYLKDADKEIKIVSKILYETVKDLRAMRILELGCGYTTYALALASSEISGSQFTSADIDKNRVKIFSEGLKERNLNCNLVAEDSIECLLKYKNDSLDFIFIDSNHEFRQTLLEICLSAAKLDVFGRIFLHDTKMSGVAEAIRIFLYVTTGWHFMDLNTSAGLGILLKR